MNAITGPEPNVDQRLTFRGTSTRRWTAGQTRTRGGAITLSGEVFDGSPTQRPTIAEWLGIVIRFRGVMEVGQTQQEKGGTNLQQHDLDAFSSLQRCTLPWRLQL